jgi:hypothetical protein
VADDRCWFVLREKYCWLIGDGWFILREKYCWLMADKPNEQCVSVNQIASVLTLFFGICNLVQSGGILADVTVSLEKG